MDRWRLRSAFGAGIVIVIVIVGACSTAGSAGPGGPASPGSTASRDPATDKLARVLARGTLVLSTDLEYPPQSYAVDGANRSPDSACAPNQMTATEVGGYDTETGKAVAAALGVEPCFVTPPWTEITGGNWGDRWDVSWGSGSINADRMTRLWMTQPYYAVENFYFVRVDSPYQVADDLSGKTIGACASCSHEYYLKGELEIPGVEIVIEVEDPQIVSYQGEVAGLEDVADGSIEAFLAAEPVGQEAISSGLTLRALAKPAFTYYPSGFVDKSSGLEVATFVARINEIIRGLHADGTLRSLSLESFGADYAAAAASFDLEAIGQVVR